MPCRNTKIKARETMTHSILSLWACPSSNVSNVTQHVGSRIYFTLRQKKWRHSPCWIHYRESLDSDPVSETAYFGTTIAVWKANYESDNLPCSSIWHCIFQRNSWECATFTFRV